MIVSLLSWVQKKMPNTHKIASLTRYCDDYQKIKSSDPPNCNPCSPSPPCRVENQIIGEKLSGLPSSCQEFCEGDITTKADHFNSIQQNLYYADLINTIDWLVDAFTK
ncbi:unnamed protein product [Caenorhabditis nigoni]|uniref:Uncharacterized protein n=1 Tax=Caenorhabditis nigoni TaxID=1611254 RepID=A0A2G5SYC7_9PELO|nr:hypothetical protein B9Z55_025327 [Caenorhabditis nigoni]